MADTKASAFTNKTIPADTDRFPLANGTDNTNSSITYSALKTALGVTGGGGSGSATMTNKSGSNLSTGAVVKQNTSYDSAFTTTTTVDDLIIGVLGSAIDNDATGPVYVGGTLCSVLVQGNVARGDYLRSSSTAGRAESAGVKRPSHCIGVATSEYTGGGSGAVYAILEKQGVERLIVADFDGAGGAIVPDTVKGHSWLLPNFTVRGWEILDIENTTGYIEILVCCDTYANFPPTYADDMVGIHLGYTRPKLNSAAKNQATTCDWNDKVIESLSTLLFMASGYLGAITFTGGGLNDMKHGSNSRYTYTSDLNYKVEIDGTGSPNTFKWSDDGGSTWDATGVSITAADQSLNNGITIRFGATTGHTSGNNWAWTARTITAKHAVVTLVGGTP